MYQRNPYNQRWCCFLLGAWIMLRMTLVWPQSPVKSMISGVVVDAVTNEPLVNVNLFLANTMIGGSTGPDGAFLIKNVPAGAYELVARMIGYEIQTLPLLIRPPQVYQYLIKLAPRPLNAPTLTVTAKVPTEWQKQLKYFKKLFLGTGSKAQLCTILNPQVLDFKQDPKSEEFTAFSDCTLFIENRALGYHLEVSLNKFKFQKQQNFRYLLGAYIQFEEMTPLNAAEKSTWVKNRGKIYQGSFRHFLTALGKGKIKNENFEIFALFSIKNPQMAFPVYDYQTYLSKSDTGHTLKLIFPHFIAVKYKTDYFSSHEPAISYLSLNEPYAELDSAGVLLTPYALTRYGVWAEERVADFLPLDYEPILTSDLK